jgi:hypothetical protein
MIWASSRGDVQINTDQHRSTETRHVISLTAVNTKSRSSTAIHLLAVILHIIPGLRNCKATHKKMFAYVCIVQLTLSCQGCYFVRATAIDSQIQRGIWEPLALLCSMFNVHSITRLLGSWCHLQLKALKLKLKWGLAVGLHHVLEARHIWRLPAWTIIKRLIGQFVVTQTHCSHCRTYLSLCFPVSFCVLGHCFGVK